MNGYCRVWSVLDTASFLLFIFYPLIALLSLSRVFTNLTPAPPSPKICDVASLYIIKGHWHDDIYISRIPLCFFMGMMSIIHILHICGFRILYEFCLFFFRLKKVVQWCSVGDSAIETYLKYGGDICGERVNCLFINE